MNPDNDIIPAPADFLAEVRAAAKHRFGGEHGQPVDASVDDRQQPEPATLRNSHIHREAWLHDVAASLGETFRRFGHPIPDKVRLTCGFPSVRGIAPRNQRIGECWSNTRSGDDHYEILVSPVIADSMRVAGILAHELIHASVGVEHGHKGPFRQMAKALGLEGKMTATTEGEPFKRLLAPILEAVGPSARRIARDDQRPQETSRAADQMRVRRVRLCRSRRAAVD